MQRKKQDETEQKDTARENQLRCHVCGRVMKPQACSWQEDDDGTVCCQECRAEMESCGCSD